MQWLNNYEGEGIDVGNTSVHLALSEYHRVRAEGLLAKVDLCNQDLVTGLSSYYWLMPQKPSTNLISILSWYPPGSTLADNNGWYWVRRSRMTITRHRFISCIGDDQEKYYEQKFLFNVPITDQSEVVQNLPTSWIEHCVQLNMYDMHIDALACMQSGISRGISVEALRSLAQLYIDNGFLTHDEADAFLTYLSLEREMNLSPL